MTNAHAETSPRVAARAAGLGLLAAAVAAPIAYMGLLPRLVVRADPALTVANLRAHEGLFLATLGLFLVTYVADLVIAWALWVFMAPAGRGLAALAGLFRAFYTAIAVVALLPLVDALRLVRTPEYEAAVGTPLLHAQIRLLTGAFRWEWGVAFVFFALHLVLLGVLVVRSTFVPRVLGVLLAVNGVAYLVDSVKPYLFPAVPLPFLPALFLGELVFMVWLLARGSKLPG